MYGCALFNVYIYIDPVLVMVGMVMSVEERRGGGGEVERKLVAWLEGSGMEDPHGYFTRQLGKMADTHQVTSSASYCNHP